MRDGALPAIALCLALGMLFAYASRRAWFAATGTLIVVAVGVSALVLPLEWQAFVVIGCWAAAVLFTLGIYCARPVPLVLSLLTAALAGALVGAQTSETGRPGVLVAALPFMLVRIPAAWLVERRRAIVLKVLASWILAVAILSTGLTIAAGVNSGADHIE